MSNDSLIDEQFKEIAALKVELATTKRESDAAAEACQAVHEELDDTKAELENMTKAFCEQRAAVWTLTDDLAKERQAYESMAKDWGLAKGQVSELITERDLLRAERDTLKAEAAKCCKGNDSVMVKTMRQNEALMSELAKAKEDREAAGDLFAVMEKAFNREIADLKARLLESHNLASEAFQQKKTMEALYNAQSAALSRLTEALKNLEWGADAYEDSCEKCPPDERQPACPDCFSHQHDGHADDCQLFNALKEAK